MIRSVIGFLAGVFAAVVIITIFQTVNFLLVPKPEGFDPSTASYTKEFIDGIPVYGFFILALGYLVGSFVGAFVMGKIVDSRSLLYPVSMAILFILSWTTNIVTYPHPTWILILVYLIYLPASIFGFRTGVAFSAAPFFGDK